MKITIYSLSRSGHHAITFWLAKNIVQSPTIVGKNKYEEHEVLKGSPDLVLELRENEALTENEGPSIIILRDPFNNFASYSQLIKKANFGPLAFFPFIEYWKTYAKEVIGETNLLKNKIVISYNDWESSEEYRKSIVNEVQVKFGIPTSFTDANKTHMTPFGGGSSFDGLDFVRQADKMKVHERFKQFEHSISYRRAVDTPEIRTLSEKIFRFYPWKQVEKSRPKDTPRVLEDFFS